MLDCVICVEWCITDISYKMTNKKDNLLFPCYLVALHVSSDIIAHHT